MDDFCCGYGTEAFCPTCGSEAIDSDQILKEESDLVWERRQKYLANREKHLQSARNSYLKNPGNHRERARKFGKTSRGREAVQRYREKNPELTRERDIDRAHRRRARQSAAPISDFSRRDWRELLAEHDNRCFYCGIRAENTPQDRLTRDHKLPLVRGGSHTRSNIVPACLSCNLHKHTKTAEEFLLSLSR